MAITRHCHQLPRCITGVSVCNPNTNIRGRYIANGTKENTANYRESISERDYCSMGLAYIWKVAHMLHCKHSIQAKAKLDWVIH